MTDSAWGFGPDILREKWQEAQDEAERLSKMLTNECDEHTVSLQVKNRYKQLLIELREYFGERADADTEHGITAGNEEMTWYTRIDAALKK